MLDPGLEIINLFSCSTQQSMILELVFLALKQSDVTLILLINGQMPITVGILTFISMIKSMLSLVKHDKIAWPPL